MTTKNAKSPLQAADAKAFGAFIEEFKNESDRAAVILGAAKLDVMLYQLLQNTLRPSTSKNDELLDGDSPLATFSARIGLCHRLGLIDDNFCRALHMIRKIRNSFAHEIGGISLESGAHRDRIRELVGPLRGNEAFDILTESAFGEHPGTAGQFRSAVALAAVRLEGACQNASQIEDSPYSLLPKNIKRPVTDSEAAA
jgi:hypothetical protein